MDVDVEWWWRKGEDEGGVEGFREEREEKCRH